MIFRVKYFYNKHFSNYFREFQDFFEKGGGLHKHFFCKMLISCRKILITSGYNLYQGSRKKVFSGKRNFCLVLKYLKQSFKKGFFLSGLALTPNPFSGNAIATSLTCLNLYVRFLLKETFYQLRRAVLSDDVLPLTPLRLD